MADLQTEWAGVLQRWGNSTVDTVETVTVTSGVDSQERQQSNSNYSKYDSLEGQSGRNDSHERQSVSYNKYSSHEGHSENYNKYDSYERQSSKYDNHGRQSGQRVSVRQQDSSTDRQNTRDRQERETGTGGKTGGRQRWSSVSRGSVSPGKENCDTIGYRSRSATRSPTTTTTSTSSRLYSSTVASRAKQITPVLTELGPGRKSSRSSPRSSHSRPGGGATPSTAHRQRQRESASPGRPGSRPRSASRRPLQPTTDYNDNNNTRRASTSKSFSSLHRSSSQARSSVSPPSSGYHSEGRKSSGTVKISLSSLKKASIESWDGDQPRQGKKKSVSSVYIG